MASSIDALLDLHNLIQTGEARRIRERAGISATEVARELDVNTAAVTRWETGARFPRGANARRYARMLKRLSSREAT